MKKFILFLILFVATIFLPGCDEQTVARYEAEFLTLFDTVTKIVAYTDNKEDFEKYVQFIYDELKRYHDLYDIYHNYEGINNLKTINDNAGVKPVKVDKEIIDLIKFCKDQYDQTDGKVNIAFGSVLKIWNQYRTEGIEDPEHAKLPSYEELKDAAKHTAIDKVIINEEESTVFLSDAKMSLDVGSIAKGFAVQRVIDRVIEAGFTSGLISVGGNVCAIGTKGYEAKMWNVGIQSPFKGGESSVLDVVYVKDAAIVTSGDYERYYTVNGKKYHHIIDTKTLFPSEYFTSVTIICKDSGVADALSTAVFNMPFEEGLKYINTLPDTEAMWLFKDGERKYSEHFKDYLKN